MKTRLVFAPVAVVKTAKTKCWHVSSFGTGLGYIKWFTRWRRYVFYPLPDTLYDASCLREIAEFCAHETREQQVRATVRRNFKRMMNMQWSPE
jgi:hypothetical protein